MGHCTLSGPYKHYNKMMKLVVLAVAVSAVYGAVVPLGAAYPGLTGLTGLSGLPVAGAYSGLTGLTGLPLAGAYSGLTLAAAHVPITTHTGYSVAAGPVVHGNVPVTYAAAPAQAIVAPQPYSVHTGTKVEVAAEPVEQHGYVIKY